MSEFVKSSFCGSNGSCVEVADEVTPAAAAAFRASSYCGTHGACVEAAIPDEIKDEPGQVLVRDSKLGDQSPVLDFGGLHWLNFIAEIKAGKYAGKRASEYDHLFPAKG